MWGFRATLYEGEGGALRGALLPVTVFLVVKVTGGAGLGRWERVSVGVWPFRSGLVAVDRLRSPQAVRVHELPHLCDHAGVGLQPVPCSGDDRIPEVCGR